MRRTRFLRGSIVAMRMRRAHRRHSTMIAWSRWRRVTTLSRHEMQLSAKHCKVTLQTSWDLWKNRVRVLEDSRVAALRWRRGLQKQCLMSWKAAALEMLFNHSRPCGAFWAADWFDAAGKEKCWFVRGEGFAVQLKESIFRMWHQNAAARRHSRLSVLWRCLSFWVQRRTRTDAIRAQDHARLRHAMDVWRAAFRGRLAVRYRLHILWARWRRSVAEQRDADTLAASCRRRALRCAFAAWRYRQLVVAPKVKRDARRTVLWRLRRTFDLWQRRLRASRLGSERSRVALEFARRRHGLLPAFCLWKKVYLLKVASARLVDWRNSQTQHTVLCKWKGLQQRKLQIRRNDELAAEEFVVLALKRRAWMLWRAALNAMRCATADAYCRSATQRRVFYSWLRATLKLQRVRTIRCRSYLGEHSASRLLPCANNSSESLL